MDIKELKNLFTENPKDFFKYLENIFEGIGSTYNRLIIYKTNLERLQADKNVAVTDYDIRFNQICESVYEFIDKYIQEINNFNVTEENEIITALKKIPIQWSNEILGKYNSNIKTFLVFSEKHYEKGINWFWANHLLNGKEIDCYLKAQSNDTKHIKNLLSEIFQDRQIMEYTKDELLHPKTIDKLAQNLIARLKSKNLYFIIDECIGLLKREDDEINFFSDIWQPICKIIESENITNHLEFFLVQFDSELKDKHTYTSDIKDSIDSRKPFLIQYNGFRNPQNPDIDLQNLKTWIEEDDDSDEGVIAHKKTVAGKKFKKLFKENEEEYLSVCECGNIEKLFDKIANDFGYMLNTSKKENGKIIWELVKQINKSEQQETINNV